jgi:RNA polymerase sigma-70 factor, ECF subfamily
LSSSIFAARIQELQYHIFSREYVQRLTEGDVETEHHFVAYFSELLLIKLRRTLRSHQAVEDVRQEIFLRVFSVLKNKGGIDQPEKLGSFVYGVCSNVLAEHYRSSVRHAPQETFDFAGPGPDPETGFVNEERKRSVRQILEELPSKDRQILRLIFLEELEKDEVCRICRVDRDYLRVLLHRAKNRFRAGLSRARAATTCRVAVS